MNQQQVWNKIASKWSKFRVRNSPTVLNFLKDKKGKLLDDGCGSGRNFVDVKDVEWHGTDFSDEMIKFAEINAREKGIKIKLVKADSLDLPFEDNFFNNVICVAVLHCVDSAVKRKKVIEEIFRVLKKNGTALISAWGSNSPRLHGKEKECEVPWTVKESDKTLRYTYIYDLEELKKLAEEVGFTVEKSWEERNVNLIVRK